MKIQLPPHAKRIIFVNVDGVLTNANRYWLQALGVGELTNPSARVLDPSALLMLAQFCKQLDAVVVMASAWVVRYPTVDQLNALFAEAGVPLPVIDALPMCSSWQVAAREYMADMPDVDWVLFEDDAFPPPGSQTVVSINKAVGLTTANLELAAEFLAPESEVLAELRDLNRAFGARAY